MISEQVIQKLLRTLREWDQPIADLGADVIEQLLRQRDAAVREEREECAKIADAYMTGPGIAAEIRNRR